MRKYLKYFILNLILTAALICCYTTIYAEETAVDTIKIGLFYGSTAKESVTISSSSGFYMGAETDGEFIPDAELTETEIVVSAGDGTAVVLGAYVYDTELFPTLYPIEGTITVDGTEYRGGVQFKRVDGGALTVINVVNMEEYLYSVIGKEMSPSWNLEALKAQAVCARGFAISNYNKYAKYGFNLDTSTNSQVYKGVSTETESTRRAADETKGQVLKHDGSIIQSIYCASMGGASANAENVWGGSYPYLVSVTDPYENPDEATHYSWTVTMTADEIKTCLENAGVNIGDITALEIINQDNAGYVTELLFTGTDGTHTVKRSSCRTVFGGKLHSQRYTLAGGVSNQVRLSTLVPCYSSLKAISSAINGSIFQINTVPIKSKPLSSIPLITTTYQEATTLSDPVAATASDDGNFTFNGNGWGHGVGMSQWGAKAMADQGYTYEDILTFYYTGTYLENAY